MKPQIASLTDRSLVVGKFVPNSSGPEPFGVPQKITGWKIIDPLFLINSHDLLLMADIVPYSSKDEIYVNIDKVIFGPLDLIPEMEEYYDISLKYSRNIHRESFTTSIREGTAYIKRLMEMSTSAPSDEMSDSLDFLKTILKGKNTLN